MDHEDLDLFARSLRDATAGATGADLDGALDALGWRDALVDDPRAAVSVLFELQGESSATSSALGWVLAHDLVPTGRSGTRSATVLPAAGRSAPPGTLVGARLRVDGLALADLGRQSTVLVVARTDRGDMTACTTATDGLDLDPVVGADPDIGLVRVAGEVDAVGPGSDVSVGTWETATAHGRLAIGHELVGGARAMLDLACSHARERVQFGRPIAGFQAVRHRLAETLVAIATAEAMLDAAWLEGTPDAAAMAKAVAGRQARTAARHCQQVLAGIGFTVEHPFHRHLRRTLVLDALLGTSASLTTSLGSGLIAARRLPPLLPL